MKTGGTKHMYSVGVPFDRTDVTKTAYIMGSLREARCDQAFVHNGFPMIRRM